jgi:ABC-type transporter Mla subunit MlaD
MRRRTPLEVLAAAPTMIGAITTLIVIVAVFLAYNANTGLPFVPTYRVSVEIPNAARLVPNNEVRIGGSRVGVIESVGAVRDDDAETGVEGGGDVVARLDLKLDESVEGLPEDSSFRVRYRSAFGLKFLEITRGEGPPVAEGFVFDGTDRDGTFVEQTEFDDIGNTFDQPTRNAIRQNLLGYGDALAGRGGSLNLAIQSLEPLLRNLQPVASVLAAPDTRIRRLFPELAEAAAIVAPVAGEQAELFTNMAIAFGAISADVEALQETISETPPTLGTGIRTLPAQQTFLAELTDLTERLRPGARQLRLALPDLNSAVITGTPVLARTPRLNRNLREVFRELEALVEQPTTLLTLERLKTTFSKADRLAEFVTPAQTVCNYWNYWMTLLPEHLSERDSVGYSQRVSLIESPLGSLTVDLGAGPITIPGEVETGLSVAGYSGLRANGIAGPATPSPGEFEPHELPILHANATGPTGQDGSDCQSGQTGYLLGRLPVSGQPRSDPAVVQADLPGDRGPTTVFFKRNGERVLKDTRVPGRQP